MTSYRIQTWVLIAAFCGGIASAGPMALAVDAPGTTGHDWPQWRGPHFDGSSEAVGLPETFGPDKNLLWTAALPGMANSTPVNWGERIFVGVLDKNSSKLMAMCLDLHDGHLIWQHEMGASTLHNNRNDVSSPSPVTDGKTVIFTFGTGDMAAFDMDGKPLWGRDLQKDHGEFHFMWIYGSSPTLFMGKLYFQCLHNIKSYKHPEETGEADSYLLAIDPATGKDLWKVARPNVAIGESKESYGTPIPSPDGSQILLAGGDCVTGQDPDTGKEIWRYRWNPDHANYQRLIPSPAAGVGIVVACAPKGGAVMAVKDTARGDVTDSGAAWVSHETSTDVCVPLFYKHFLYVLNGDKLKGGGKTKSLSCIDPKTGSKKWEGKLDSDSVFRTSPVAAEGKIYFMNETGDLWVVAASADEFKVLNKTSLGGKPNRSTIILTDGHVLVRAGDQLFAFGKK